MHFTKKKLITLVFSVFIVLNIFPKEKTTVPLLPIERIPDSSTLRKTIAGTWLLANPQDVLALKTREYTDYAGKKFKVESYKLNDTDILEVKITPKDTIFTDDVYERSAQGTWILQRNFTTGEPIAIKIYPRETSELFINLHPSTSPEFGERSYVDFCLFSAYVRKNVAIAIPFTKLYYTTLIDLKTISKDILPWNVYEPPTAYNNVESTSNEIRKKMVKLVELEDGGFDAMGNPVYIETEKPQKKNAIIYAARNQKKSKDEKILGGVNCSGFVKWIVDGIIKPIAGQGTYISSLKRPTDSAVTHFTEPYMEERDLFFGLHWIRNLAAASLSLTMKRTVYPQNSGVDVKVEPFAFTLPVIGGNISEQKFGGYFQNIGYQTEYLQALLYYLAITEPGNFYLGTVSREMGKPALRQYYHTVAFFPYFDMLGAFHIDVYEVASETTIEKFINKNRKSFTFLVRIKAPEKGFFNP